MQTVDWLFIEACVFDDEIRACKTWRWFATSSFYNRENETILPCCKPCKLRQIWPLLSSQDAKPCTRITYTVSARGTSCQNERRCMKWYLDWSINRVYIYAFWKRTWWCCWSDTQSFNTSCVGTVNACMWKSLAGFAGHEGWQTQNVVTCHKEESVSRVSTDYTDRDKIRQFLATCIDPLNTSSHTTNVLVNISDGKVTEDKCVKVHQAVDIGSMQCVTFEKSWPKGFYDTITKSVRTIASATKSSRLGHAGSDAVCVDHTLMYARTMGLLSSSRYMRMNDVL